MKYIGIGLAKEFRRTPERSRRKFADTDPIEQILAVATALPLRDNRRHLDVSFRQRIADDARSAAESAMHAAAEQLDANEADLQHAPPTSSGQYSTAVRSTGVRQPAMAPWRIPRRRGSRAGGVP